MDPRIGYMLQKDNLLEWRTIWKNVLLGLELRRQVDEESLARAEGLLKSYGLWEFREKYPSQLSGGMRQKVYIAMALAQQAGVIVMDEPTTYLDIGQQAKFAALVRELSSAGKTLLLVLHDLPLALKISDKVAALSAGKIIFCGSAKETVRSKIAEELYGVAVKSVPTEAGEQYYYELLS